MMTYFRLRDIQTPPFAYTLNKDQAVQTCTACHMPHETLLCPLEVEIRQPEHAALFLESGAMMADHWLIGNAGFAARLERILPGQFERHPVLVTDSNEAEYFYFWPRHKVDLRAESWGPFATLPCHGCGREIPEISFETEPMPDMRGETILVAALKDFHFEGYDYLFHRNALKSLGSLAASMILEPLVSEAPVLR